MHLINYFHNEDIININYEKALTVFQHVTQFTHYSNYADYLHFNKLIILFSLCKQFAEKKY